MTRGHGHELLPRSEKPAWAQWFWRKRGGMVVALVAVLSVLVLKFVSGPEFVAKLDDIATEIGSVAEFWSEPSPNHAGTCIVYQQSTEMGVGVFFAEVPTGSPKLLHQIPEKFAIKDRTALNLSLWGWSPDDSLFAFSHLNGTNRQIVVCNGKTGEREAEAKVSRQIKGLVWLDADTVAFVNEKDDLYHWGAGPGKRGSSPVSFVKNGGQKSGGIVRSLCALSADTIAWHDGSSIWSWRFGAERPAQLWDGVTNNIVAMDVASGGRYFLLRRKDSGVETVARVPVEGGRYEELRRISALDGQTNKNHIVWLDSGFVHAWGGVATYSLSIYPRFGDQPKELVFRGGILSYTASGNSLYVVGSRSGEPLGVWRFIGDPEKMTCVLSNPVPQFRVAKPITPERAELVLKGGGKLTYSLWTPPRLRAGKKYPLIVGGPCWGWDSYRGALVNGGAYLVNIERDDWYSNWTDGVPEMVEHLRATHSIDEKELYLFGTSAQVWHGSKLVEANPETWRGILMFSPGGAGPRIERVNDHRLFLDCGADDRYSEGALKYRDEVLKRGVAITSVVHEDAEHTYRSIRSIRARDQAVTKFMFER